MTADDYKRARKLAKQIAGTFAVPKFNTDFRAERDLSFRILHSDPLLERSRRVVTDRDENFGHGLKHSEKVAVDAGVIVKKERERQGFSPDQTDRHILLVQLASLLHDVCRRMPDHAKQGATAAKEILTDFPLQEIEREWIVQSIANHEAFVEPAPLDNPQGQLLSDALYDADKFRWGPDNFVETLWDMISFNDVPIRLVIAHFPKGMKGIRRIIGTFRSSLGKQYGPEFIEIGLAIGDELYEHLRKVFPPEEQTHSSYR
jgi:hypothetical protein